MLTIYQILITALVTQNLFCSTLVFAEIPNDSVCSFVKSGFPDPRNILPQAAGLYLEKPLRSLKPNSQRSFHGKRTPASRAKIFKQFCDKQKLNDGELS